MVKQKVDGEGSRDRFKRLAVTRAKKVLDAIRVLGHCSNRQLYEYDGEDVREIFQVIEKELRRVKAKFEKPVTAEIKLR